MLGTQPRTAVDLLPPFAFLSGRCIDVFGLMKKTINVRTGTEMIKYSTQFNSD